MDARELTEKYHKQKGEIADLEHRVEQLEQIVQKMQIKLEDMVIDVKMLQPRR